MVGDLGSIDDARSTLADLRAALDALSRKIEGVQAAIDAVSAPAPQPQSTPLTEPMLVRRFAWESDEDGIVRWVEGAPRAAIVGLCIAGPELGAHIAARRPYQSVPVRLPGEGVLSGDWEMSGVPFFDPASGRFLGYRGTAARVETGGVESRLAAMPPDMVRQVVHELRTPLNAICGFADMIDGEYLGPASPAYRGRAAEISREARRLLDAVQALDHGACQAARGSAIAGRSGEGL